MRLFAGKDSEWTFDTDNVRPYGLLLCNVDYMQEKFAPYKFGGAWKASKDDEFWW